MILYNVTVKLDKRIQEEWLKWMQSQHMLDVRNTGYFESCQISKLLYQDDADGDTYVMQYRCKDIKTLTAYFSDAAPKMQEEHSALFKDKYVAFRTIMEIVK